MKLHTGDTVVIISGKDKGKTGTILRVFPADHRVVVGGINMRTRHVKRTPQNAGSIVKYEAPMHASKVMAIDPKTKKRTRIAIKVDAKGNKTRVATKSKEAIVAVRAAKQAGSKAAPGSKAAWKKAAPAAGDVREQSHMQTDHSIPDQSRFVRAGGARGS